MVLNRFAPHNLSADSGDLVGMFWRSQHFNRHADGLGGRVSVEAFGSWIPTGDDSVYVSGEDGVVRRFDHGGHLPLSLLGARLRAGTLAGETGGEYRDGNKYEQPPIVIGRMEKLKRGSRAK